MSRLALVVANDDNADLVRRIDAEHAAVAGALQSGLGHTIAAGELLIEAKRRVQHGEWRPWLEAHCTVPARTARHYMALARQRKRLCDQNGNVLPISVHAAMEALRMLSGVPEPGHEMDSTADPDVAGPWCGLAWGTFAAALRATTRLVHLNPPRPAVVRESDKAFADAWADAWDRKVEAVANVLYRMAIERDLGAICFFLKAHKPAIYNRRQVIALGGDLDNPLVVHNQTGGDQRIHFFMPPNGRDRPEEDETDAPTIEGEAETESRDETEARDKDAA